MFSMEVTGGAWWLTVAVGGVPLLVWLLWWFNELRYVLRYSNRKTTTGAVKLPPGHMGFPFIGELLSFLWYFKIVNRPDDFINSKIAKYGEGVGMYRTYLFGNPSIIACAPSINRFVFHSDTLFPYRFPTNDLVGPNSLLAATGKHHARVKSYVAGAVSQLNSLRNIALLVQPHIEASLRLWVERGTTITTADEVKKIEFENIAELFASIKPGPVLDKLGYYYLGLLKGFKAQPFNIPGTTYYHAVQCRKKIMGIFMTELIKRKLDDQTKGERKKDLMDALMEIKDEEGKQLSNEEVVDNVVTLLLGGFESTASSVTWAIYYLAKYPKVLEKLREENMELSKRKEGKFVTYDEISKLSYTSKVVEETIRMANISGFVFRSGDHDVEYEGYLIPKGWKVIVWVRYLHTNPNYFDDPTCFNPDRWTQSTKPDAYQPFGLGSMMCVGIKMAKTQLAIFLHHFAVGYKWELVNPDAKITYLPHPKPVDGVEISITRK